MTMPSATETPAPPAGQGDKPSGGDTSGGTPKMYTQEELDRRFSGAAKERERVEKAREAAEKRAQELQAELKRRDEATLAEQGKDKELAARLAKERDELAKERDALRAEKQARDDAERAACKERIKGLKDEERRKRLLAKLDSLDPTTLREWVSDAEAAEAATSGVDPTTGRHYGGTARPPTSGGRTQEDRIAAKGTTAANLMLGRKAAADRGVQR